MAVKKVTKKKEKEEEVNEEVVKEQPDVAVVEEKLSEGVLDDDKVKFIRAIGRRKESVAIVKLFKNGSGKATINNKDIKEYLGSELLVNVALGALLSVNQLKKLDVVAKVNGGGKRGQAEAIRLGTSRALLELNPVFKKNLKKVGYLTRDSRTKERKKPGLKKARRAPQWSKR